MPHFRSGALALICLSAMSSTALAQVSSPYGAPTSGLNLETDQSLGGGVSGNFTVSEQLKNQIQNIAQASVCGDPNLCTYQSQAQKEQAIQNLINQEIDAQYNSPGTASCAQQYDDLLLGLDAASAGVELGGTIAEAIGAVFIISEIPGVVMQAVGTGLHIAQTGITGHQNTLPNCNADFTGSVKAWADIVAAQGIAAHNGAIKLGTADGLSYFEGITLGGGSLAGAGYGGAPAFTDNPTAVAIGNGSSATGVNATAFGTNATADGEGATALGAESDAVGVGATAVGYHSNAAGDGATAVGHNSNANGTNATAIGTESDAIGAGATALGYNADAAGTNATAVGTESSASAHGASAFGTGSNAAGVNSVAVGNSDATNSNAAAFGEGANASGENSAALGAGSNASGWSAVAVGNSDATNIGAAALGFGANASGFSSVALGAGANAAGTNSVAVGNSDATGQNAAAFGEGANADGHEAMALGNSDATEYRSLALGAGSSATASLATAIQGGAASGEQSLAVGIGAMSTEENSLAVGTNANASATGATAIGLGAQATGAHAIAIGTGATATGSIAMGNSANAGNGGAAFGDFSTATGTDSAAFGPRANATGANSAAFGAYSSATGEYATAMGYGTQAAPNGSVAIGADDLGNGAMATLANQFVLGTANHTYTAPGIASQESKNRQVGQVNVVTNDQFGNLADDGGMIFKRLDEHDAGIAMATAMENPSLVQGERFGIATAWGTFKDAHAFTASVMGVVGEDVFTAGDRLSVFGGVGMGFQHGRGEDVYGGRAGAQWTF